MNKSEYRRAFIMLRPAQTGYSGHARLERRTMTGSLYFIVSAPAGTLYASLAGQRGGNYYAAPLGALREDSRGQFTLAWSFDPRNIDGRPLEAYQLLTVSRGDDDCQVVLTGNVDGAYPMDTMKVQEAVCALYLPDEPAGDLPSPAEVLPEDTPPEAEPPAETASAEAEAVPVQADALPEPEAPVIPLPAVEAAEAPAEPETAQTDPIPESPVPEASAGPRIFTRMSAPSEAAVETVEALAVPETACPAKPEDTIWRVTSESSRAARCAMPLEDGYTYVRVPLPAACGVDYCLLGIRADDDRVTSVRVALPGTFSETPSAGLEGAVWLGAGSATGYWITTIRCPDD